MITQDVLEALNTQKWDCIFPHLVLYAKSRLMRLKWQTNDRKPVGGQEGTDIAKEAIAKVFSGERRWDPASQPDIQQFLRSVVNSLCNHLVTSADHMHRSNPSSTEDTNESIDLEIEVPLTPFDELLYKDRIEFLRREINGDPTLDGMLICIEEGIVKPQEMASFLEVEIDEIYNGRKRMKRMMDRYNNEP